MKPRAAETLAVNVRAVGGEFDVYVGRAVRRARDPRCRVESPWANPIRARAGSFVCGCSEESVNDYRAILEANFDDALENKRADSVEFLRSFVALRGKRLGCWCVPGPCHAEELAWMVDRYAQLATEMLRGWGKA